MNKKLVIFGVAVLLICVGLSGCNEESIPKTITVGMGGNYTIIQEAINNANNGDTIKFFQ
ncbi:unnamed protein product [marine sediment metagenome]|uniref:Uncharacterized protein n=1 Tax=marine sediment metagenome TaxID=412755 RepID=X1AMX5_9ZZZZ